MRERAILYGIGEINFACARNYRPCFRENQPKRSFSIKWKRAFWACFRENWVYKFGHWTAEFVLGGGGGDNTLPRASKKSYWQLLLFYISPWGRNYRQNTVRRPLQVHFHRTSGSGLEHVLKLLHAAWYPDKSMSNQRMRNCELIFWKLLKSRHSYAVFCTQIFI